MWSSQVIRKGILRLNVVHSPTDRHFFAQHCPPILTGDEIIPCSGVLESDDRTVNKDKAVRLHKGMLDD